MAKEEEKDIVLKLNKLSVSFNQGQNTVKAVNELSYELARGETLGIVGESGSGKSVSSLAIIRLLDERQANISGRIEINHNDEWVNLLALKMGEMPPFRGNIISMIFQEPMSSLNPSMKCGKQVDETILIHETKDKTKAKAKTLALFKRVGLQDPERIYRSYPHELSGGQIQRIMISLAVACSPKILIADEPTTALDVTIQQEVLHLLKELQEEYNMSLIFISHDLGVIKQICDRVLVMQNGNAVEFANTDQIFENPLHPYTKGLIACRPPLDFKMSKLPTVTDFLNNPDLSKKSFIFDHKIPYHNKKQEGNPLLEVNQLNTWYQKSNSFFGKKSYVKALNDVDLKVYKGECLGLVGESGSGKSTLSKSIMRIVTPQSGEIIYKGHNILEYNDKQLKALRKDIQIVFQNPYASLNPRLTIGYMLLEPLLVHKMFNSKGEAINRVQKLLEMVGLSKEYYDRYPHELSGGQRQRVVIARALTLEPEFLICDECVSALDVSVQAQIINLLLDLKSRLDLSLIFISHDLAVVQFISDRVIVMQGGKIVERGNSNDIIMSPKTDYTKRLISAIPS